MVVSVFLGGGTGMHAGVPARADHRSISTDHDGGRACGDGGDTGAGEVCCLTTGKVQGVNLIEVEIPGLLGGQGGTRGDEADHADEDGDLYPVVTLGTGQQGGNDRGEAPETAKPIWVPSARPVTRTEVGNISA